MPRGSSGACNTLPARECFNGRQLTLKLWSAGDSSPLSSLEPTGAGTPTACSSRDHGSAGPPIGGHRYLQCLVRTRTAECVPVGTGESTAELAMLADGMAAGPSGLIRVQERAGDPALGNRRTEGCADGDAAAAKKLPFLSPLADKFSMITFHPAFAVLLTVVPTVNSSTAGQEYNDLYNLPSHGEVVSRCRFGARSRKQLCPPTRSGWFPPQDARARF